MKMPSYSPLENIYLPMLRRIVISVTPIEVQSNFLSSLHPVLRNPADTPAIVTIIACSSIASGFSRLRCSNSA